MLYDDGRIACTDTALLIRWYYPWGAKQIPYSSIRSVERRALGASGGRWRIWGSSDFVHWYNLDRDRTSKQTAFEIHTGRRVVPVITPDDPDAVEAILGQHIAR